MFLSQRKGSVMIRDVVKSSLNRGDTSVLIWMPKANGTVGSVNSGKILWVSSAHRQCGAL